MVFGPGPVTKPMGSYTPAAVAMTGDGVGVVQASGGEGLPSTVMSKALMLTPGVTETLPPLPVNEGVEVGVPVITNVPELGTGVLPKLMVWDSDPSMVPVALIVAVTADVTVDPSP